jgi:hypothetical protein
LRFDIDPRQYSPSQGPHVNRETPDQGRTPYTAIPLRQIRYRNARHNLLLNLLETRAKELISSGRIREAMEIYYIRADGDLCVDAGYLAYRLAECPEKLGVAGQSPGGLERGVRRQYLSRMLRRGTRILVALLVALGLAVPAGVRAMPMPGSMAAMAADQPCQHCPRPNQTTPDKMPGYPAPACISAPAVLPSPVLLLRRILLQPAYVRPVAAHLAGAEPAPDTFPPRPLVLR